MRASLCVRLCVVCSRFVRVVYSFSVSFSSTCILHLAWRAASPVSREFTRWSQATSDWTRYDLRLFRSMVALSGRRSSLFRLSVTSTFPWLPSLVKSSPLSQVLGHRSRPFGEQTGARLNGSHFIPAASSVSSTFPLRRPLTTIMGDRSEKMRMLENVGPRG